MNANPGDLVVCVDDRPPPGDPKILHEGRHYTVTAVALTGGYRLAELAPPPWRESFRPSRFRKIRPDEHEPCEVEFVELLNRSRVPVRARSEAAAVGGR